MLSDEEKEKLEQEFQYALDEIVSKIKEKTVTAIIVSEQPMILLFRKLMLKIEKQSTEIEELKETLKCTQNSWFEDTQKIEEMKKQIDLDNECEIALNNKIMDLEKEIEELKNKNTIFEDNYELRRQQNISFKRNIHNLKEQNKFLKNQKENFVHKDKIKARIKELEEYLYRGSIKDDFLMIRIKAKIQELQSLLEKE